MWLYECLALNDGNRKQVKKDQETKKKEEVTDAANLFVVDHFVQFRVSFEDNRRARNVEWLSVLNLLEKSRSGAILHHLYFQYAIDRL